MSLHQTLKGGLGFLATEGLFRLASFPADPPLGEREKIKSRLEPSSDPDYRPLCEEHSRRRGFLKSEVKGEIGNMMALVSNGCSNPAAGKLLGEGDTRAAGVLGRRSSLDAGRRSLGGRALSKEHPCRTQRIALEAKMLF